MKLTKINVIASTKNNLKINMKSRLHRAFTCNANLSYFAVWTKGSKISKVHFSQVMFVWAGYKSLCIYINTVYVNKNHQKIPFIIRKCGVSPFYVLIVASLRINQFYVKIDKLKQNHTYTKIIP